MSPDNLISKEEFLKRRERFMRKIGDGNVAVVVSGEEIIRNGDRTIIP